MDAGAMGALAGVVMMFFAGVTVFSFTGLGKALARRIGGGQNAGDPGLADDVAHLAADVADLRRELRETQERLDFTERMLSQAREQLRLTGGKPTD